jgi:hypothetical protein
VSSTDATQAKQQSTTVGKTDANEHSALPSFPHAAARMDGSLLKRAATNNSSSKILCTTVQGLFQSRCMKATKQTGICCWPSDAEPNCRVSQHTCQTKGETTVPQSTNHAWSTTLAPQICAMNNHQAKSAIADGLRNCACTSHRWEMAASSG